MCLETVVKSAAALTLCFQLVVGFNIDSKVPIVRTAPKDSYFGFSVAQHLKTDGANEHVIIVGAPRDNGTSSVFVRPGAVYQCPLLTQNGDCSRLSIDESDLAAEDPKTQNKSDQWLGVSVASTNTRDGLAVTCAHRYRKIGTAHVYGDGICFMLDNDLSEISAVEPCSGKSRADYDKYIICQVGTSSAIDKSGGLLLGTPSALNWRGTAFKSKPFDLGDEVTMEDDMRVHIGSDSLLGMSARIGERLFQNGKPAYVVGAPKSRGPGEVFIYQENGKNLTVVGRLSGPKFYSGFGYEILVGDFNGDKKDDIIVGAPFYFEPGVGGAIFIYFNNDDWSLSNSPVKITSRKMKDAECKQLNCHEARFGFSLANIGDLNKDGVEDFVVGAPFEGPGAIYVFHGSSSSKIASHSQRIAAAEVSGVQPPLRSFGYSLSGGGDIDGNAYSDLAVGSYQSDSVVILRARPIVNIAGGLESIPKQLDPKTKSCFDGKPVNCLRIKVCLKMTAEPKDKFQQPVNVTYRLETEKFAGVSVVRMYFGDNPETFYTVNSVSLRPQDNSEVCRNHTVYLKPSNKNFYNAVAFRLTYDLPDSKPPTPNPNQRPPEFYSYPVLNASTASKELQVSFIKNCGQDEICNSSLRLNVGLQLPRVDGEYELNMEGEAQIVVNVSVTNLGEDAHEAVLRVTLPENVFLTRIIPKERSCSPGEKSLDCELGNPVVERETVIIQIILDPNKLDTSHKVIDIGFAVNTTSVEKDFSDDVVNVRIKVATIIDLSVIGTSDPKGAYFSSTESQNSPIKNEEQIGQEIRHKYDVINIGSVPVSKSRLTITWPFRMVTSSTAPSYILYIMEGPTVQGIAPDRFTCEIDSKYINPLNVKVKEQGQETIQTPTNSQKQPGPLSTRRPSTGKAGLGNLICGRSSSIECIIISCDISNLRPSESASVKIRTRLWNRTLASHFADESELSATSEASIASLAGPTSNVRDQNNTNNVAQASTKVNNSRTSEPVAIWIIVLAVCAGLLLLIIVIVVLWRIGFFKRRKPEFYPEHRAAIVKSGEEEEQEEDKRSQEIQ